eukprot:CAMPEP_0181261884 /NCGR_PEP_ID=MMETSP1097-20121128/1736_1 /TAXON_ID=35684 /ORGANISM="Pseudopedinella elastica, Strain CCMP716" /LENGTH=85 /DNA_ID=CAMNT_0023360537 /DNA_START=126 /DNA_END=380 /DNA_ORIENTATION=+
MALKVPSEPEILPAAFWIRPIRRGNGRLCCESWSGPYVGFPGGCSSLPPMIIVETAEASVMFMWRDSGARCWDCLASLIESDVSR